MTRYEHTQIGHVIIWSLLAIILIASGAVIGSSSRHEPTAVLSVILLACLVLFYKLRITIEDETLCASFGPGIVRKIHLRSYNSILLFLPRWRQS